MILVTKASFSKTKELYLNVACVTFNLPTAAYKELFQFTKYQTKRQYQFCSEALDIVSLSVICSECYYATSHSTSFPLNTIKGSVALWPIAQVLRGD